MRGSLIPGLPKPISEACRGVLRGYFRKRADFWVTSIANTAALYNKGQMTKEAAKSDIEKEYHFFVEDKGIVEDLFGPRDLWGYFDKRQVKLKSIC